MQKTDVECDCGAVYTRIEVARVNRVPQLHQFKCGICGRTLEAGMTLNTIGYRLTIEPDFPFQAAPEEP